MASGFNGVVEVSTADEWYSDGPDAARLVLSAAQVEKIGRLAQVAVDNEFSEVRIFDYAAEYGFLDDGDAFRGPVGDSEEQGVRIECCEMCVTGLGRPEVHWVGLIKHTDIRVSTERLDVQRLVEGELQEGQIDG